MYEYSIVREQHGFSLCWKLDGETTESWVEAGSLLYLLSAGRVRQAAQTNSAVPFCCPNHWLALENNFQVVGDWRPLVKGGEEDFGNPKLQVSAGM